MMHRIRTFALLAMMCTALAALAQPPDTLWTRYYGSYEDEVVYGTCIASDGGIALAGGGVFDSSQWHVSGFLIKVSQAGVTEWIQQYEADSIDDFRFVSAASDGGFLAGGRGIFTNPRFIKTDAFGQVQWLFVSPFNSYAVLDFGGMETSDGRYLIYQSGESGVSADIHLFCFNHAGDTMWSHDYGDVSFDRARAIFEEPEGFVLLGSMDQRDSTGRLQMDAFLLKTDFQGNETERYLFHTPDDDWTMAGDRDGEGGYYLSGYSQDSVSLEMYRFCRRITVRGETVWLRTGDVLGQGRSFTGRTLGDGSYLMGGGNDGHPYLMDLSPEGNVQWFREYPLPHTAIGTGLGIGSDGSACVGGYADRPGTGYDVFLMKTTRMAAFDTPAPAGPSAFVLGQNYPNPFNSTTVIPFAIERPGHYRIELFNVLGERIGRILECDLSIGQHQIIVEAQGLPTGGFYYLLSGAGQRQIQRATLIR